MTKEEVELKLKNLKKVLYIVTNTNYLTVNKNTNILFYDESICFNWYTVYYSNIKEITDKEPLMLDSVSVTFGSDPELFFVKDGKVIPSSVVVLESGGSVIRDGFQGELNPSSDTCRQVSGTRIAWAVLDADRLAKLQNCSISLDVGHVISDDVWNTVPISLKRFGCNPTLNEYEKTFTRVTGLREKFRAAGGHIHLGYTRTGVLLGEDGLSKIIKVLDIVCGNTCVLVDRDPNNARRRKNYGRAGEYRIKPYGIEYRVLSNFWLKSYVLWSFVSGLCRNSLSIVKGGYADELIARFDMKKVRNAINNNDYNLALENFNILKEFIKEKNASGSVLDANRIDKIEGWLTSKDPLKAWNTVKKSLSNWETKTQSAGDGFEQFIDNL